MDSGPVATFQVHEYLRPKVRFLSLDNLTWKLCLVVSILIIIFFEFTQLCDLYENDSIFDKFECCLSGDGLRVATGSYRSGSYMSIHLVTVLLLLTLSICHNMLFLFMCKAICSECLVVPQEVLRHQL